MEEIAKMRLEPKWIRMDANVQIFIKICHFVNQDNLFFTIFKESLKKLSPFHMDYYNVDASKSPIHVFYRNIVRNPYHTPESILLHGAHYVKAKSIYNTLRSFINRIKNRKRKHYDYPYDLLLTPLSEYPTTHLFKLTENNCIYTFYVKDLINIINKSLSNDINLVVSPNPIKNPYTNLCFLKSSLYNIYFYMKFKTHFKIPILFHHYFKCNFELEYFYTVYEPFLRKYAIDNLLKSNNTEILYEYLWDMIIRLKRLRLHTWTIHPKYPHEELFKHLMPFLKLYMYSKYLMNPEECNKYLEQLKTKFQYFSIKNPHFGEIKKQFYAPKDAPIMFHDVVPIDPPTIFAPTFLWNANQEMDIYSIRFLLPNAISTSYFEHESVETYSRLDFQYYFHSMDTSPTPPNPPIGEPEHSINDYNSTSSSDNESQDSTS